MQLSPLLRKRPYRIYLSEVFVGSHQGVPLALVGPMLGAPQAVLVLEKLIALGVTEVMAVGWCGSLQPDVKIGDLVLPTGAFSEEGTSPHLPHRKSSAWTIPKADRCAQRGHYRKAQ